MWKDITTFSKGDTERIPSVWIYEAGLISITVHRHIHYEKDDWLISCGNFYNKKLLKSKDIDDAKKEAIDMVKKVLTIALNKLG